MLESYTAGLVAHSRDQWWKPVEINGALRMAWDRLAMSKVDIEYLLRERCIQLDNATGEA
jgi:hypothetical protein